jgi:Flp pilus assembly CpaF family ATPase
LGGPNIQEEFIKRTVSNVINYVIHLTRNQDGFRYISEIIEIKPKDNDSYFEIIEIISSNNRLEEVI